jgi:septum formation inhibitor MinC
MLKFILFVQIQPELITLDNNLLGEVDVEKLVDDLEQKPQHYKKSDIEIAHRKRRKSAKIPRIKEHLLDLKLRKLREEQATKKQKRNVKKPPPKYSEPLDRFIGNKK